MTCRDCLNVYQKVYSQTLRFHRKITKLKIPYEEVHPLITVSAPVHRPWELRKARTGPTLVNPPVDTSFVRRVPEAGRFRQFPNESRANHLLRLGFNRDGTPVKQLERYDRPAQTQTPITPYHRGWNSSSQTLTLPEYTEDPREGLPVKKVSKSAILEGNILSGSSGA